MVELTHSTKAKQSTNLASTNKQEASINPSNPSCATSLDKHRLEDILENIPSAVVVFDKPDGKVIYANKRAIELHGKNPCGIALDKQAQDLKIFSMDGKPCPTEELYTYRALFNEETFRDEPIIIERPDGERFIVNVSAKPLYNAGRQKQTAL